MSSEKNFLPETAIRAYTISVSRDIGGARLLSHRTKTLHDARGVNLIETKQRKVKHCALSHRNDYLLVFLLLASTTNNAYYYDCWREFGKEFSSDTGERIEFTTLSALYRMCVVPI